MEQYQSPLMFGKREQRQELTLKNITSLLNKDGFLHSDSHIKAEILNHQFQSVYTKEDTTTLLDKDKDQKRLEFSLMSLFTVFCMKSSDAAFLISVCCTYPSLYYK
jgi:hypothetical protein